MQDCSAAGASLQFFNSFSCFYGDQESRTLTPLLQALDVMQPIDRAVLPVGEVLYQAYDQALPISPTVQSLSVIRAHLLPLRRCDLRPTQIRPADTGHGFCFRVHSRIDIVTRAHIRRS